MDNNYFVDINGLPLKVGDKVEIVIIPDGLVNVLDKEALELLKSCLNRPMPIMDIDDYLVWLEVVVWISDDEYYSHLFGLEPSYLLKRE